MRLPLLILLLCLSFSGPAQAAISLRLTGMQDMTPPDWSLGNGDIKTYINTCVLALGLTPIGGYQITATTSAGSFNLKSGSQSLPFQAFWSDAGAGNLGADGAQLSYNSALTGLLHGNLLDNSCSLTGPNARLTIKILDADLTAAIAGTYSTVIYITLGPA